MDVIAKLEIRDLTLIESLGIVEETVNILKKFKEKLVRL